MTISPPFPLKNSNFATDLAHVSLIIELIIIKSNFINFKHFIILCQN